MKIILSLVIFIRFSYSLTTELLIHGTGQYLVTVEVDKNHRCEGVLVQENLAITAAECVQSLVKPEINVQPHKKLNSLSIYGRKTFKVLNSISMKLPVEKSQFSSTLINPGISLLILDNGDHNPVNITLARCNMNLPKVKELTRFPYDIFKNKAHPSSLVAELVSDNYCEQVFQVPVTSNEFCARTPSSPVPNMGSPIFTLINDNPVLVGIAIRHSVEMFGLTLYSRIEKADWLSYYLPS